MPNTITQESKARDALVLDALDRNISDAPKYGICCEVFVALKYEFERVMKERDDMISAGKG
nr:MAG TPA: hypothetical protein [Caudoviricetes sp.]